MTLLPLYSYLTSMRCVEPKKRNKDGLRWISHRFPIRNGITWREAMLRDMTEPNHLLRLLVSK